MAKAKDFLKALEGASGSAVETVAQARARQKEDWLQDLSQLRTDVREWLAPVIQAQRATAHDRDFDLSEPDLGEYTAPGLEIRLAIGETARTVLLRPRGMRVSGVVVEGPARITGASGRVDLECGVSREILLRFKNEVVAWLSFANGEKRVVTDEVFFDLLAGVTELKLG